MIKRVWHGWTTPENADAYESVLSRHVIPDIEGRNIPGYCGFEVFRADTGEEVEFVTIMTFASLQSICDFLGDDFETPYIPSRARPLLSRWNTRVVHYEARTDTRGTWVR